MASNIYLTGNPQITFFKVVYRRHTNFAISIQQTFNGTTGFGKRVTCTVSRNGDLVHRVYLEASINVTSSVSPMVHLGHALMKDVEVEIGGQRIDKHYSTWLQVWNELSNRDYKNNVLATTSVNVSQAPQDLGLPLLIYKSKYQFATQVTDTIAQGVEVAYADVGYRRMAGDMGYDLKQVVLRSSIKSICSITILVLRNPGLALPLIALQYHEVKFNIQFEEETNLLSTDVDTNTLDATLWVDYIYLDTDERRRFAQVSHEYLIEQLQHTGTEAIKGGTASTYNLNFNHPVKELVWCANVPTADKITMKGSAKLVGPSLSNLSCNLGRLSNGAYKDAVVRLQLNGHDRFAEENVLFYTSSN